MDIQTVLMCNGCDEVVVTPEAPRCLSCLVLDAEDAQRGPQGRGFTYHLPECPKSRGSISGCICRDDEHCEATKEPK